jgi:hypothetical protein
MLIRVGSVKIIVNLVDATQTVCKDMDGRVSVSSMLESNKNGCQFTSIDGVGHAQALRVSSEIGLSGCMIDACTEVIAPLFVFNAAPIGVGVGSWVIFGGEGVSWVDKGCGGS